MAVWVGPECDSDGQPTTLHVAYSALHHVSEAEAQWLRDLIAFKVVPLRRAQRAEAEVKRLREVLHSALGYLSAEDDPQARRICVDAALALDGIA